MAGFLSFVVRRGMGALAAVVLVSLAVFGLRHAVPGDPATAGAEGGEDDEELERTPKGDDALKSFTQDLTAMARRGAIDPLIKVLDDPELTGIAVSALFYLSPYMADIRIADAMIRLLERPRGLFETQHAIHILEELKDARLATVGLHLLDHAPGIRLDADVTERRGCGSAVAHEILDEAVDTLPGAVYVALDIVLVGDTRRHDIGDNDGHADGGERAGARRKPDAGRSPGSPFKAFRLPAR